MSEDVEINVKGLDALIRVLQKVQSASVRVGVLGPSNQRSAVAGETKTPGNAEIGAIHEFGTATIPERSFLRMPVTKYLGKKLEELGPDTGEALAVKCLKQESLRPFMEIVGITAVGVINEAFASGGFGEWAPHSPGYENNTGMLLVDTTQLRNAVTYEVKAS
jgi:phage gpG-like protein